MSDLPSYGELAAILERQLDAHSQRDKAEAALETTRARLAEAVALLRDAHPAAMHFKLSRSVAIRDLDDLPDRIAAFLAAQEPK